MTNLRALLLSSLFIPLFGCGHSVIVDGFKIDQENWEAQRSTLLKRAAFDINCPEAQLKTTILAATEIGAYQMGVSGCDRRLTYVTPFAGGRDWLLNAVGGQPVPAQAAAH